MSAVPFRIVLVDDHPLVRQGLAQLIAGAPGLEVCGQAGTVEEVLPLLRAVDPDALVLDLMLGRGHGLELLTVVLREFPHLQVLVLSMQDHRIYADRCLRAGAKGYLRKEDAPERIVEALLALARGDAPDAVARSAPPGSGVSLAPLARLSDREMRVFELIGSGLSTRAIAALLGLSDKTVEAHKAHIKRKLGVEQGTELARIAAAWWALGTLPPPP